MIDSMEGKSTQKSPSLMMIFVSFPAITAPAQFKLQNPGGALGSGGAEHVNTPKLKKVIIII